MKVKNCTLIEPLHCTKETTVMDVAKQLRENKQRRCIVVEDGKPIGIISTTDMNNRVVAEDKTASELKAADIMTSPLFLVADHEDDLNDIYKEMVEQQSFFVPVVKDAKLHGILTYGELRKRAYEAVKNET